MKINANEDNILYGTKLEIFMRSFSDLKKSGGFSLLEMMTVLGIMTIISLTVAQIMVNAALQERSLQVKLAGMDFHKEMKGIIAGDTKCGFAKITDRATSEEKFNDTTTTTASNDGRVLIQKAEFITDGLETDSLAIDDALKKNIFTLELRGKGYWSKGVKSGDNEDNLKVQIISISLVPFKTMEDASTATAEYTPIGEIDIKAATATYYKALIEIKYNGRVGSDDSIVRYSRHPVILTMTREYTDDGASITAAYISDCSSLEHTLSAKEICETIDSGKWVPEELECYVCQYGLDETSDTKKCNKQPSNPTENNGSNNGNWLDIDDPGQAPNNYKFPYVPPL